MLQSSARAGLLLSTIICILLGGRTAGDSGQCSVERSKHARHMIHKYLLPKVEKLHYELPASCPLHPNRDMYWQREHAKVRRPGGYRFSCALCNGRFPSEDAWERHFDTHHHLDVDPGRDVCLADYSEVLHCHKINLTPLSRQMRAQQARDYTMLPHAPCRESTAEQLRNSCHAIAATCFPASGGPVAAKLHRLFKDGMCAAHTCNSQLQEDLLEQLAASERGTLGYKILVGIALVGLCVFYACLWLYYQYRSGSKSRGDVKRLQRSNANKMLALLGLEKPKVY